MISWRWTIRTALFSAALLLSFSPIGFSSDRGIATTGAQCETCCPQRESTCIVCGTSVCIQATDYFMGKVGTPCANQITPNIPG